VIEERKGEQETARRSIRIRNWRPRELPETKMVDSRGDDSPFFQEKEQQVLRRRATEGMMLERDCKSEMGRIALVPQDELQKLGVE